MVKTVMPGEIDRCRKNCEMFQLGKFFTEDWIKKNLLKEMSRRNAHPLFWVIILEYNAKELSENLQKIPKKYINKIVGKLKDKSDKFNLHSALTETQVLPHYFSKESKNYKVEYEKPIPSSTEKPDLHIKTKESEYYAEILTVFENREETMFGEMQEDIREKIDELSGNPFMVSFKLEMQFKKENTTDFVSFIEKMTKANPEPNKKYDFIKNNEKLAQATFNESKKGKGFTGVMQGPLRRMNDSGRIKNKLLDKTEQLPPNTKNFVVINLKYILGGEKDFEDVFFGQLGVIINKETNEAKPMRQPNSILNHPKGKRISAFITYCGNYKIRNIYLNTSADNPLSRKELFNI